MIYIVRVAAGSRVNDDRHRRHIYRKVYYCLGYLGSYYTQRSLSYVIDSIIRTIVYTHSQYTNNGLCDRVPVATNSAGAPPELSGLREFDEMEYTTGCSKCNCTKIRYDEIKHFFFFTTVDIRVLNF